MTDCGSAHENCCISLDVTGGTYNRTYRNSGSGPTGQADPATVANFRMDKYLVTVGRYRQFAAAWTGGWMPAAGSG
jgi:formylglycine-generating enzyme required for sulfatase activity